MCWEKGSSHLICFQIAPAWWLVKLKRASLWTNQMKPLHQIHLKALLYSYVRAYRVNCPPRTDSFQSGWIWLQFKIPETKIQTKTKCMSLNGKLLHNVTFWKRWRLRQRCVSRFIDISVHFFSKCVDEKHFMRQFTVPKLEQTKMLTLCWNVTRTVPLKSRLHRCGQIGSI